MSRRLSAFYEAGPVFALGSMREQEPTTHDQTNKAETRKEEAEAGARVEPVLTVHGGGLPVQVTVVDNGGSSRLQGRTGAEFCGGAFETRNVVTQRATGRESPSDREYVRVTGTLMAKYSITTRVTLPKISDFPDLTPRQRQRVRDAIDNVLAPHMQQHVAAFGTYSGRTVRPFDLTIRRSQFDTTIRSMFEAEERARRNAGQAASDLLDPFHFDVDLNREDDSEANRESQESEGGELDADTEE
ncbi:MAG: hypothetical protein GY792_25510 [Gammaproteobacteria bacterium]|nr:hypothetical protein [Gammaproteobacteria bacterium]